MKKIAILASGGGSNAEAIIQYFKSVDDIEVSLIVTNKIKAGVIDRGQKHNIPVHIIDRNQLYDSEKLLDLMSEYKIDLIVLAGFLLLVPIYLIQAYPEKILNIHPALLPQYGGKGMYGVNVHKAVKENRDIMSGITIHLVNEKFDEGKHLFQASCRLEMEDTSEDIGAKVLKLEHKYYPKVIHYFIEMKKD